MTIDPDADTLDLTDALAELRKSCDCAWHQRWHANAATRLCAGSAALTRRPGAWIGTGDRTTAGPRLLGAAVAVWACTAMALQQPLLIPAAASAWCITAWRQMSATAGTTPAPSHDEHQAVLLDWLDQITTGRNGIHLAELYERLRDRPALAHLDDTQLRSVLDHYGIPIRRSMRVNGIAGRSGIHRDDIKQLLSPTEDSPPLSSNGDAGQPTTLHPLSDPGEEVESTPCDT